MAEQKKKKVVKTSIRKRDELVRKEVERLTEIFKEIPENKKNVAKGLIIQAARLRVLLDEMWIDITKGGDYELFSQSPQQEPYERERPVAKLYNSRDVTYQRAIKQLTDLVPEEKRKDVVADPSGSDLM